MGTSQLEILCPPQQAHTLELWLQHAAGRILFKDVRAYATEKIDPTLPDETRLTADSLEGMVDVHARRPVAVSAEDARRWLDPGLTPEEAEHLARTSMLDAELFE